MTEQRYLEDSSVRSFEARVERTLSAPDRVVLSGTHFYPEGGGQPADSGRLVLSDRERRVTDVQKRDTIYHHLDGSPPEPGTTVRGELDWNRRYAHMRYHTAQHLLSALMLDSYGAQTRGNQLYSDRARIDVEHGRLGETALADIEATLNELVDSALPVRWYTMARAAAERQLDTERTRVDLLPDSVSELRIVEIGDPEDPYDRTACAGTHVDSTADIGSVTVTGRETAGEGRERLRFTLE